MATVSRINVAPVKALGLVHPDEVLLEETGVRENRRFHLVDEDGRRYNQIRNGDQAAYRTVTVQLQNEDHTAVVQTWKLLRARIIKHVSGPMNAKGTDVAMEELTLAYERLEME